MINFTDAEGFVHPMVFLIASLFVLFLLYKKHLKWTWLSVIPLVMLWGYQAHIEDVRIERKQIAFAEDAWTAMYEPYIIDVYRADKSDLPEYDAYLLETEGGTYRLRFLKDQTQGFEVVSVIMEVEPLRARRNVLNSMDLLGLEGLLQYVDGQYTFDTGEEVYTIALTSDGRVKTVKDEKEHILFENKEKEQEVKEK